MGALGSGVYLLHVDPPYQGYRRHYIGWTGKDPIDRLYKHQTGKGGKYTARVHEAGCMFFLTAFWPGETTYFERHLKDLKTTRLWCPHCGENKEPIPQKEIVKIFPKVKTYAFECKGGKNA